MAKMADLIACFALGYHGLSHLFLPMRLEARKRCMGWAYPLWYMKNEAGVRGLVGRLCNQPCRCVVSMNVFPDGVSAKA